MIMTLIHPMGLKNMEFMYIWNVLPTAVSTPRSVVETYV